ncbi:MAG TPA: ABC transporter permease subunit [Iamia sp.]|nr:ABC transporter permease subunit [Iamia sp.]
MAKATAMSAIGVASMVVAWVLLRVFDLVPEASLPWPTEVAAAFPRLFRDDGFRQGMLDTLGAWLLAVAITSVVGVAVGLLVSTTPGLTRPSAVAVNAFRSIPATALIPLAILVFGLGTSMKVAVAVYAVFWPVLINTVYGVVSTEPMRLDAARSLQWPWWRRQVFVILPSALPSIVTGLRLAVGTSLVVVISAELLGARSGVGTVLVAYQQALAPEVVYAGTIVVGLFGLALYTLMVQAEARFITWVPRNG